MTEHYVNLKTSDGTVIQVPKEYAKEFKEKYEGKVEEIAESPDPENT